MTDDLFDRYEALTFDDVVLVPGYSEVLPDAVDTTATFAAGIVLSIPVVSAAMDKVTEARMAVAMAREGGIGVIHRNLTIDEQAAEVQKVKRSQSGMITDPVTLPRTATLGDAEALMAKYRFSGVPITDGDGKLVGILTNRDIRFCEGSDFERPVSEFMISDRLVTASVGTTLEEAKAVLQKYRIEKLPLVDDERLPAGPHHREGHPEGPGVPECHPRFQGPPGVCRGRRRGARPGGPRRGAGGHGCRRAGDRHGARPLGRGDQGHRTHLLQLARRAGGGRQRGHRGRCRGAGRGRCFGGEGRRGCRFHLHHPGGGRLGHATAVGRLAHVPRARSLGIPVIADGGITYSGDLVKAIAAGAETVMLGSLLAGTEEAPGELELFEGRRYKSYRGMGSLGAMQGLGADRYASGQAPPTGSRKLVPEGIEGRVPYAGSLGDVVYQLVGGLRSGMGYAGAATLDALRINARFMRVTAAGRAESHPHDVTITKEAPNYQRGGS
jgi:IMP dehydrogenase